MPEISLFKHIGSVKNPMNFDLIYFLEQIRDGEWFEIVKKCREIKDKLEQKAFKETMPTATFSGVFDYRNDKGMREHSGFLAMDLDNVENVHIARKKFEQDRYVFACFLSTSGTGLRVIFKVDPKKHNEAFKGLMKYIDKEYGLPCDPNSSISKPYIVSYDPYLFMRMEYEDVPVFKQYPTETQIKKIADFVHTNDDFLNILKQISQRGISIAEDYLDYIKVGFSIASKYGEQGREYFHEVSRHSSKYDVKKCDNQYDYLLKDSGREKANIATFYYLAKANGINIVSEATKTIVRTTKTGRKAGLKKEQIADNLLKFNNIKDSFDIVSQIYDAHEDAGEQEEESILYQLEMFISNNYNLEMNEVTGFLEQNKRQLTPNDLNSIFVAAKKVIPSVDYQLLLRLLKSDFIPKYNPFFIFFDSDGVPVILPPMPEPNPPRYNSPLIYKLAETIENEDPAYTSFFLRKWIVSIISAAHKVHSPLLLCLLGGQNTGKTEWFRRLLPEELQPYYAESKLDKEKDDELLMTENLVIMDDELGGKSKSDNLKLKNITSKQYFSIRRPYGDHNEKILRLAVLCGTSNTMNILSDSTGNRRIIPIEVTNINKDLYNSINKKDLFLEAFRLYKDGFDWRITVKDVDYLNKDQERYEMIVSERELLEKYFQAAENGPVRLTTTDIKVELEILTQQRLNITTLGRELERAGYRKISDRSSNKSAKKWVVVRINRKSDLQQETDTELKKENW